MKIFLSYPSERLEQARGVYDFLHSLEVSVWFDKESLVGGQNWDDERYRAQKEADLTTLICSPETAGRAGVIQREVKDALNLLRDKPPGHIFLVPLRTEELKLPAELDGYHYIDLFRPNWQFALARSVQLRFQQLGLQAPDTLTKFINTQTIISNIELRNIRASEPNFEMEGDYFIFKKSGLFWEYVNAEIVSEVIGDYFRSKANGRYYLSNSDRSGSWSLQVENYFNAGELVSLRFFSFIDFGGAHPTRGTYTRNFGGSMSGKLELGEIFGRDDRVLKYLKNYAELDVKRQMVDEDGQHDYDLSLYMNEEHGDDWEVFSQWNFSEKGLLLNLSQFSGLPFVMGVFDVSVPWDFLTDKVSEEYSETLIGRFIENAGKN